MEELHPVLNMYIEGSPSTIGMSYFDRSPQKDTEGLDYFDGEKYQAKENYYFQYTLSDTLMAAINKDLALKIIEALSSNIGNYCSDLKPAEYNPPLAFFASWQKAYERVRIDDTQRLEKRRFLAITNRACKMSVKPRNRSLITQVCTSS